MDIQHLVNRVDFYDTNAGQIARNLAILDLFPGYPDFIFTARGNNRSLRVAQATQNLLNNALKYSPPKTPIRVESVGFPDTVEIHVHNEGEPIDAKKLSCIFEPMQRASEENKQATRSVGLGLFIVKSIVEGHAGTVAVNSTAQEGTTFIIKLPRCAPRSGN